MFEEESWINFFNARTQESFSYEASQLVYTLKDSTDYDLSTEDGRDERDLDKIDAAKVVGKKILVPTIAEQVKVGQTIYDSNAIYEGYRTE